MSRSRDEIARRDWRSRTILALTLAIGLSCGTAAGTAHAERHYTLLGTYPGAAGGGFDLTTVAPMERWQRKRFAILNLYGASSNAVGLMEEVWTQHGAVPMLSFHPPASTSAVASGYYDDSLFLPLVAEVTGFLAGPDQTLGTEDDRRAYLRYAWESNYEGYPYSPCNRYGGESSRSFRRAWRHVHGLFAAAGITRRQLAWVYSVSTVDPCRRGAPERTTTYGDSRYTECMDPSCRSMREYRGFSAYRRGVEKDWVKGATAAHPRYLTARRFLGR